jgi:hypothetical protein
MTVVMRVDYLVVGWVGKMAVLRVAYLVEQ